MSGFNFPVVLTTAGAQPTPPATLNTQLIAYVAAQDPGYTVLPAGLIEDLSSTATGALVAIDNARVELLNSLTPYGCNEFVLAQLGAQAGIIQGQPVNTSVNVVFTGTAGYVLSAGFLVGDGTHTYQLVDGTVIGSGGTSPATTAVAVDSGSWAVPANTVTQLLTSVPGSITLSVNNPVAGTPATSTETPQSYRSRTLQAGRAAAQGLPSFIRTAVQNVSGVVSRSVSIQSVLGSGLRIVLSGGDTYEVANAILQSVFDPSALLGSAVSSGRNVTVSINNYPDTYQIEYVQAPTQAVTLALTWNTSLSDFAQASAVAAMAAQPLADYVNSVATGIALNQLELNDAFVGAIASILDESAISKMVWTVTIGGSPVSPTGTLYIGDPESYPTIAVTDITITQG